MMMSFKRTLCAASVSALFFSAAVNAVVSPEQVERLGNDLTPLGAEMAGNADGSIPAWDPSNMVVPPGFEPFSGNYPNPYADEKPLFTIDASNWQTSRLWTTSNSDGRSSIR